MSEIRCHPQPKVRCICAAESFVCGASWPDTGTVAIRCRGHPFSAGFRYASSHLRPGSSIPARLRATAGIPGTPQSPALGPALFPCCRVRASGGVQARPPDKGAHHIRPSGPPDVAQRRRHHHHDDQTAAERHLRPAADEVGLHAVHVVDAGIEALQRGPAVVAALPGRAPQASACNSGRPPPPGLPVRTWRAWPDECPPLTPAAAKAPGRTPVGSGCRRGRRHFSLAATCAAIPGVTGQARDRSAAGSP